MVVVQFDSIHRVTYTTSVPEALIQDVTEAGFHVTAIDIDKIFLMPIRGEIFHNQNCEVENEINRHNKGKQQLVPMSNNSHKHDLRGF
jgi:hypothetical protein